MPIRRLMRDRDRFANEILDAEHGEEIFKGTAAGEAMIISQYGSFQKGDGRRAPKKYKMTWIPTNKRIVVYQANGWISKDRMAEIPLKEIKSISFLAVDNLEDGKFCVTEFVTDDDSDSPSIIFKFDTADFDELEYYKILLHGVAQMSRIKIADYTDYTSLSSINGPNELFDGTEENTTRNKQQDIQAKQPSKPQNRNNHSSSSEQQHAVSGSSIRKPSQRTQYGNNMKRKQVEGKIHE